jgi:hypothetical protein
MPSGWAIGFYAVTGGKISEGWFGEDILGMLLQPGTVNLPRQVHGAGPPWRRAHPDLLPDSRMTCRDSKLRSESRR